MSVDNLKSNHPEIADFLQKEDIRHLRRFQQQAIEFGLFKGKNLLITTPTGSGKTLIGELAILNSLLMDKNKKTLFLVPLKAVANEKHEEFRRKYGRIFSVQIATGDYDTVPEELAEANLVVATYERFDSILRTQPQWLSDITTVVIDEVHMINEEDRGPRLESVIIRLKEYLPSAQLICLSATVRNWEELSDWLNSFPIISNERPVDLRVNILDTPSKFHSIIQLIEETVQMKGQVLVFVMTRREAEFLALRIGESLGYLLKHEERVNLDGISELSTKLRQCMPKGVAYHHAGLIANDRRIVESYFRQGIIKTIVCTTTLAAGINVPARLVILKDIELKRQDIVVRSLTSNEIFQILGRAGRPGLDEEGIGVILVSDDSHKTHLEGSLYLKTSEGEKVERYEPILSQFDDISALREQVLVKIYEKKDMGLTEDELVQFLKKTFWAYLERREGRDTLPRYAGRTISEIIEEVEPKEVFERGNQLLLKTKLLKISKNRLVGAVGDYLVSFDERKGHYCNCDYRKNQRICPHLVAFALFCESHPELDAYTKTIVRNSLEKDIFTYLHQAELIKIKDGRYFITDFGRAVVLHYIHPETSQTIHKVLLNTPRYNTENILLLAVKILTQEFSVKYTVTELLECLRSWIDEQSFGVVLKTIEPGDFESIRSSFNWILNSILGIGRSMGSYTENLLKPIVTTLMERVRVGVREDMTTISPFFEYTDRERLRKLHNEGIKTVADLLNQNVLV